MATETEEYSISPYADLTIVRFKSAKEKLLSMSTDEKLNRMKVGTCHDPFVRFIVYRTGRDNFVLEEFADEFAIDYEDEEDIYTMKKIVHNNLTADEVMAIVGRHNIMTHEMFELPSGTCEDF